MTGPDPVPGPAKGSPAGPLVAGAVLVALAAAATAWVAGAWDAREREALEAALRRERSEASTAEREAWERSRRAAEKDLLDRLEALQRQAAAADAERRAREADLLAARSDLESLRREGDAREKRASELEQEVLRLRREAAALEARAATAEAALVEARKSAAEGGRGAPSSPGPLPLPGKGESGARPAPPSVTEVPPPGLGPTAVTDAGQVRKVVDGLNALLAGAGGRETFRVTSAAAVDGDRLVRVGLETRAAEGGLPRTFQAEEARFVLLPASRTLEIRLRGGTVTYMGTRTVPFLDGKYTAVLTVDPAPFQASGNPLVTISR